MNTKALPYGAREIVEIRGLGKRPADMILVSLVGQIRESNPIVVAKPCREYDWRFLVGLDVLLVVSSAIDQSAVRRVVDEIQTIGTGYFGVWFVDKQAGRSLAWGKFKPAAKASRVMFAYERAQFAGIGAA